ncbi:glycoside hydrolase domain-containing protein [Streptomyces sp. 3214.6]|uniref:glycoside hydrolase domain-containing protein n=1 Tax=Streptomyces sp. 3214.6 TaxID=1882757 RepID=UPI00090CA88D|nr:glycoside hydrolase domain-containing protein [Streptomyces sp. 3214.6]SHH66057.1 Peptidoglycan-binding (PGRP) domain of peptidoglycan hydrolases-containing protein [Streptomyces sp. 3214.6]
MADQMVIEAQKFINSYNVAGIPKVEENGRTGWAVMFALTRALQYEVGITSLSDNFGPTTLATLQARHPVINAGTRHEKVLKIVQSALYCKGYDGGGIDGTYNDSVAASVRELRQNMGVDGAFVDGVSPKVFKALLTMDAYVVIEGGSELTRAVQQWMNGRYVGRRNFFIVPCDGHFSRDVQKALMFAIQYEIGMSDDVANGVFGPGTQQGIRNNPLSEGSSGTWVSLFTAAMIFNKRGGVFFDSHFDADLATRVRSFQNFAKLPVTGRGDFQTWASLLVSTGDATRRGAAADCVTEVTDARAVALRDAGYQIVGRYLSNVPDSSLDKKIKSGELGRMAAYGLSCFPIYQTWGGEAAYFRREQGIADAFAAIERAKHYGFKPGTRIYFAVDFDALDYEVTDNILPHFRAIRDVMNEHGQGYLTGIYGPRNVCSRVAAAGYTSASFVCDMSTGFSGNLGYPLPGDWAFDQISTISVGAGSGLIEIDNNIVSGRDAGQNTYNPEQITSDLDVSMDMSRRNSLLADVQSYLLNSMGVPEKGGNQGAQVLTYRSTTEAFDILMSFDGLVTRLARTFGMRKAIIQSPLFWEMRMYNTLDVVGDEAVIDHYDGTGLSTKNDSSTGLAQIFAATAIRGRNFCIRAGLIGGTIMDPANENDLWNVWQQLHNDHDYNISTLPAVLIWGADDVHVPRPSMSTSEEETRLTLARYNGTEGRAQDYGTAMLGLHRVFEKYNAPLRGL